MNQELQNKIEELLVLARMQGVSIVGLADIPNSDKCHVFKTIEHDCKSGTRNLDEIMMRQVCDGKSSHCLSCHKTTPMISDNGLAQLFSELQQPRDA